MRRLFLLALSLAPACRDGGTIVIPSVAPERTRVLFALSAQATDGATGRAVQDAPTVLVADRSGAAVAGAPVRFSAVNGGGSVGDTLVLADIHGVARCAHWILGPTEGENTLLVRVDGADSIVFLARARVATALEARFDLTTVGGDALPVILGTAGDTTYLLSGGSYALSADGTFSWRYQYTARAGAYARVELTPGVQGTYQYFQAQATIRFYREGELFSTGSVRGASLLVHYEATDWFADEVYARAAAATQH